MTNAHDELARAVKAEEIHCGFVRHFTDTDDSGKPLHDAYLKCGGDGTVFFAELDFTYDSGFGHQQLFGTLWMKDGTWYTRGEYDGSEWWEHHICPNVPDMLT